MPTPSANIFAAELEAVLRAHGTTIAALVRQPYMLDRRKVERLDASLNDVSLLPALNHGELMTIVLMLKPTEEERLRLFAALIALGTQRLLLDYLTEQRAWDIAGEVRDAAVQMLRDHHDGDDLFPRRRTLRGGVPEPGRTEGEATLFNEAIDAYDEGIALAALAIDRGGMAGEHLAQRAVLALERAEALMRLLPPQFQHNEDWQFWYGEIAKELAEARDVLN
jgi:hypothetical protein